MQNRQTPLYDFHLAHQAKMVSFAGWSMPIQYQAGIKAEHLACRRSAALFDVSHMAQITLKGPEIDEMLAQLTPTDMSIIKPGSMRYSLLLIVCVISFQMNGAILIHETSPPQVVWLKNTGQL